MLRNLIEKTRTVRRFRESERIGEEQLLNLVDLARLGGSARNAQSLRYMIVAAPGLCDKVCNLLGWAGYLKDWPGPEKGERPSAYVICLLDRKRSKGPEKEAHFDLGIATQNLLLGAAEMGIMGCRVASFSPDISKILYLDDQYKVLLVVALGFPAEQVVLEKVGDDGDIKYWRDSEGIHHVPKRGLDDVLLPVIVPEME